MTSLKALLPLALLLLLSVALTETKVVTEISRNTCEESFVEKKPPNIPGILEGGKIKKSNQKRYKLICQTFEGTKTFVTLYDTNNKIPVFSAAKYRGDHEGKQPDPSPWMIEPQLEDTKGDINMVRDNGMKTYKHQAGSKDYADIQGYNRGHLFPCRYGYDQTVKDSTYTLTNIVPQNINFNSGSWSKMENCLKCVMDHFCINNNTKEGYVVIGAKPSAGDTLKTLNKDDDNENRVNIPSKLWSAFCCYSKKRKWLASAYWGENTDPNSNYLEIKTLGELHEELGGNFEVFPGTECPLNTNVDVVKNFYSTCTCRDKPKHA